LRQCLSLSTSLPLCVSLPFSRYSVPICISFSLLFLSPLRLDLCLSICLPVSPVVLRRSVHLPRVPSRRPLPSFGRPPSWRASRIVSWKKDRGYRKIVVILASFSLFLFLFLSSSLPLFLSLPSLPLSPFLSLAISSYFSLSSRFAFSSGSSSCCFFR
jgi:hypothetical protein